jgi:hypothetical protein
MTHYIGWTAWVTLRHVLKWWEMIFPSSPLSLILPSIYENNTHCTIVPLVDTRLLVTILRRYAW